MAALLATSDFARADAPPPVDVLAHPHTVAEFEAGALVLPTAPISAAQRGGNLLLPFTIGKGDATITTGLHVLLRGGREWAIGAGALFAPHPTSDTGYGLGGATNLPRTHSRSYLYIGGEGRYFPIHTRYVEAWLGATAGGIIIADRFDNNAATPVPSVVGVPEVTESTEGYVLGVQVGVNWIVTEHFVLGLTLRADQWFLPVTPQCDSLGDCSTLTGRIEAFEGGLTLAYRLPL